MTWPPDVAKANGNRPEVEELLRSVQRNRARARNEAALPDQRLLGVFNENLGKVRNAVARDLRERVAAEDTINALCRCTVSISHSLMRWSSYRGVHLSQALVLPKHVAHFLGSDVDAARRNVRGRTNVIGELCHVALAEPHDLGLALVERTKVCTAGRGPKGSVHGVAKYVFEREKLDRPVAAVAVEAQPSNVRS